MPSFHTKTIELILDPVAQQVSELVILHEASEDGSAMPDLSQQIAVVSAAVQNLVRVGRETTNSSKDTVLKQDMPPALNKVEEASNGLLQASLMLRDDPYSVSARKTLIEGSRGILSGTAQLLLVFDQAEVRKILKHCQGVLDYIVVAEVIEGMQDLVTFVKNLTPGMTAMANMVSARAKELTFQIHRELLEKHLDSVKSMVPLLVSAIKITVTTISQGGAGLKEAHENRNYVIKKMCYDIREIMRVLQLTTYDEDDWAMDDITVLKKAQDNIASQMNRAQEWLSDPNAAPGGIGESALRQILADSRKVADRVNEPYARNIRGAVDELTQLTDRLAELRAKGLGNTPEAQQLSNAINAKLVALQKLVDTAVQDAVRNGTGKPASTLTGKMEQAQAWLANPLINDKGVGREAIKGLVKEGRKVAQSLSGPERKELEALCDDVETLYSQLDALIRKGMGNSPEAQAIKQQLAQKLQALQQKIEKALATQVVDTFMDPLGPLNHLEKAAKAPADEPNRERTYESKATIFLRHGKQMADTAKSVAEAGSCPDKKVVGELNATANDVAEMTPQLVFAGKLVLINPGNAAATENFDKLRDKYKEKVDSLTGLVDEATDAVEFIKASEESIKQDSEEVASAIRERNSANIVLKGGNIARKARRIVTVANKEADNSEDPEFVNNVKDATKKLDKSTADTVRSAKAISMNPTDSAAQNNWFKSNGELLIDIERVKRPLIVIIPVEQQQPPPVAMPIRSSQQANLEQAPPPSRNLYTASSPQYQPSGSSSASPYASQSEGVKASPIQGDVFARPQYVGSASRPSEYGPPVPPPPAFEQASPKTDAGLLSPSKATPNVQQNAGPAQPPRKPSNEDLFPPPPPSFLRDDPAQRSPYYQGTTQHGLGPQSAPPAPIPSRTHAQAAAQRSPEQQPLTVDTGVPYSPLVRSPYDEQRHAAPFAPNRGQSKSPRQLQEDVATVRNVMQVNKEPPLPPPPDLSALSISQEESAPPRPPLPQGQMPPPRPPPPEEEEEINFPKPQTDEPIMKAAYDLHVEAQKWSSKGNDLIAAAKKMALLMAQMSKYVRGEGGSKKGLIDCAKAIAKASDEVTRLATEIARQCTDKRIRMNLMQVCERIPTIATQLKIISTVKATLLGEPDAEDEEEATEVLVLNAQNLMGAVKETVRQAEAASIKIRTEAGVKMRWVRKSPWYS
ncbi:vinculin-like isoform X7 [Apostichopus japonicus]|uniref:vinculin-like isoform X7 n=1 Tax=Stichopus japonicus TaxID=307972 RepID=UPI003AB5520C